MTGIWFSSDANITDRNLAKFKTLLPASNMTPLGVRLLSFVTQSSLSLHGSPVENADKNSCSAFIGATWRRGPTFYWGFQEPLRENFEGAFQCNLCCNTLSVRTIMNFLNLCDSFGFSFMISSVRIHTFTYT